MSYTPILRLKMVETNILKGIPSKGITPLLEVVEEKSFKGMDKINRKFGKDTMVELPVYLLMRENKHLGGVMSILHDMGGNMSSLQSDFYNENKDKIEVPVVSTMTAEPHTIPNYKELADGSSSVRNLGFDRIAVRVFLTPIDISGKESELKEMFSNLSDKDKILIDVVAIDGVEPQVMSNIEKVMSWIPENKKKNVTILNAFDSDGNWRNDKHNYAPLLSKIHDIPNFGDFATIPRMENSGGSRTSTSVIRYFDSNEMKLVHFKGNSFMSARGSLTKSNHWKRAKDSGHLGSCVRCKEVEKKNSEWKTFWKYYRIEHHIHSMVSDVTDNLDDYGNPQDFDSVGYNNLITKSGL